MAEAVLIREDYSNDFDVRILGESATDAAIERASKEYDKLKPTLDAVGYDPNTWTYDDLVRALYDSKDLFQTKAENSGKAQGGVKYSIEHTKSMSWGEQINGVLYNGNNIRRNNTLVVGSTAESVKSDGISDKPLAVPLRVISKATSGKDVSRSIKRGKIAKLDIGIREAPIVAVNPERNALIYITSIKQGGLPMVATFNMDATFDGDDVHQATSIHLQTDTMSLLQSLPKSATVYVQKKASLRR